MKKIVSLFVAALLVLGACSFALAEEKTTIVITGWITAQATPSMVCLYRTFRSLHVRK